MRPLSGCLSILIATAEDIMRRPQDLPQRAPEEFVALAQEIRDHDRRPAEGVRCTQGAIIMLTAIEAFFGGGNYHWQMLIGTVLPIVKQEAWTAMKQEKEARATGD